MKPARSKNIFVAILMTLAMMTGALVACGQKADPVISAPGEESSLEAETETIEIPSEQFLSAPSAAADENDSTITTIRIASWYKDSYLTNLQEYLRNKFPDYKFEYLYLEKNNYESLMDNQLACKSAPDIVVVDPVMASKHSQNGYIINLSDITTGFSDEGKEALRPHLTIWIFRHS